MNKIGFTLVEMLAVVVILCLLILLVFPSITNSVKNYTRQTDDLTLSMIESASKLYIDDNPSLFSKIEGSNTCIKIKELTENGYLSDPIEYKNQDITHSKSIKVIYSDGFEFEIIDSEDCIICRGVTEETKTFGNVPEGKFAAGDEYVCEVKEDTEYNFFVLSKEGPKVNLIMNKNLGETVAWSYSKNNTYGPLNALTILEENTSDWNNVVAFDYQLTYGDNNKDSLVRTGVRARMLTYQEAINLDCEPNISNDDVTKKCKAWLYQNFGIPHFGYWLANSYNNSTIYAWYITYFGDIRYTNNIGGDGTNVTTSGSYGIRPVIIVSTSRIAD